MNLLVSMGVVDDKGTASNAPINTPINAHPNYLLVNIGIAIIVVVVLFVIVFAFTWYCKRLKQKNKQLQSELEEVKKQQAQVDCNSLNSESTKDN